MLRSVLVAASAAAAALPSAALAAQPSLYVVPTVFLPRAQSDAAAAAQKVLPAKGMADYFSGRFKTAFPGAIDAMTDAGSRRTFVVSMQVSRISNYEIPKVNGNVERQLAMTGSLYFTNIRTGEVLFTYTSTTILDKVTRPSASPPSDDADLYTTLFHNLVDDLVAKSAAAFKPYEVTATARRSFGSLVVLDRGFRSGLGVGDAVTTPDGAEARTIFAEPNYSVAEVQVGAKPSAGGVWSKFSTRSLGEVRKVDAVVDLAADGNQSGVSDAEVRQLFADAVGEKTPLSVLPVNPDFAEVVNYVRAHTDVTNEATAARKQPAYYVKLTVPAPLLWEAPTNVAYKTTRNVRARVYAEVIDRAGRVQYAGFGEDALTDEVTEGMGYAPEARAEVAVKNAMLDLARKMAVGLKLEQVDAPVTSTDKGQFAAADPKAVLKVSANLTVLHQIGRLDGGDTVFVPSWTAHVTEVGAGQAKASGDLAEFSGAPGIQSGDLARLEHIGAGIQGARFQICGSGAALGSRKVAGLEAMAVNTVAGSSRATTYMPTFVQSEAKMLRATGDFEDAADATAVLPTLCIEPVSRIEPIKEDCDPHGLCRSDVSVAVGYRVRRGEDIVKKAALQTTVHSSAYFKGIAPSARDALIDADITAAAAPLFKTLVEQGDLYQANQGH